jgi:hypothetical protein
MKIFSILPIEFNIKFNFILSFISTKTCGNAKLTECRKAISSNAGIAYNKLSLCRQVHGTNIVIVDKNNYGMEFPDSDGLITAISGVPVAVYSADCLPIFIYDHILNIAGIVHAGTIGTKACIAKTAICKFIKTYNSLPENIHVALGPCICSKCYAYDIVGENMNQLHNCGINNDNIRDSNLCTYEDKRFFSYRRDNKTEERMISVIMIK